MNLKRHATFIRFLIAGGFNSLFGWLVYSGAILLGAQPWLALIVGIVMGIAFNFVTLGGYAFRDLTVARLPRFVMTYGFIYVVNLICLTLLKRWIDEPILGQLILTPFMAMVSYLVLSRMVFTGRRESNGTGSGSTGGH
ncbi:GtrA family protein [Cupriavidus basilensis]|uniref:GtrA family protein n=1 Tax=Cupriavidus basilensis TaxID=68895 RepID=A0A643FQL2_9BURK|nr:GtrA family protein [Cupriavidus basilensis]QOT75433.1 GtrA family protein [Cupriavidus basilensis]